MRKQSMLLTICSLLVAISASADPLDPDPDGIGIYADLDATIASIDAVITVPFECYILLTNPSAIHTGGDQVDWSWTCTIVLPENAYIVGEEYPEGSSHNAYPIPEIGILREDDFPFGSEIVLLATLQMVVTDPGPKKLCIVPHWHDGLDYIIYYDEPDHHDVYSMYQSSGGGDAPVFVINGDAPVMTEATSWGAVKACYK